MNMNKPTLNIHSEIEHLIKYFAYLNDQKQYQDLINLFTTDAIYARPSKPNDLMIGHSEILNSFINRPQKITQHMIGNIFLDQQTDNLILAQSQIVLFSGDDTQLLEMLVVGGFKDKIVYQNHQWLFQERCGFVNFMNKL